MTNAQKCRGFTLVELMITLLLIISLCLGTYYWQQQLPQQQLNIAVRQIQHHIKLAQILAIKERQVVTLSSDDWSQGFYLQTGPHEETRHFVTLKGVTLSMKLFNSKSGIAFQSSGRCLNNGRILISANHAQHLATEIILHTSGRVRLEKVTYT